MSGTLHAELNCAASFCVGSLNEGSKMPDTGTMGILAMFGLRVQRDVEGLGVGVSKCEK